MKPEIRSQRSEVRIAFWLLALALWLTSDLRPLTSTATAQVNIGNTTFAVSNLATYGFVNTTNNSSILYRGATIFKPPQFAYQFGPITNTASGSYTTNGITNVVKFVLQQTIDGVNFQNLATNSATGTNGDIITFTPALYNLSIGFRVQILTSNSTAAGAQAIVPQ